MAKNTISEEVKKQMVQVGTLGYPLSKILNVIDIEDEEDFENQFYDPESEIAKAYQKGVDKADFIIDSKLFNMAKNGDLRAMEKYEKRKSDQMFDAKREREKRG